jgi:6-phosphogluconolactonase
VAKPVASRSTQVRRWHIYASVEEFETHAVRAIARAAAEAIAVEGRFIVVLAGGDTPRGIYSRLALTSADWRLWHVYFGDERCLPASDEHRNDRMARSAWLDHVSIPAEQVHGIRAELGAQVAARQYADVLSPIDQFDFVLLGLGEDGHTASLFVDQERNADATVLAVNNAPKAPAERVSLSASRLSRTRQALFSVAGESKRRAVASWRRGDDIPAARIVPNAGVDILLDIDAWPDRFI